MNREGKHCILLVEDEDAIRKFLRISLEAHGFEVRETRRGEEGLTLSAECHPSLIVLDLGLPDIDGQAFIERLREWSEIPVIVLSVRADETEKVRALDAGANDYVTKPFGISELMARIRAILRRPAQAVEGVETSVYEVEDLKVDVSARTVTLAGKPLALSRKEYDLLKLMVTNAGRVLTHRQIISDIWGPERENETHYLRVLVGHLRQKLGDQPTRPKYIITEQGVGYRFLDGS